MPNSNLPFQNHFMDQMELRYSIFYLLYSSNAFYQHLGIFIIKRMLIFTTYLGIFSLEESFVIKPFLQIIFVLILSPRDKFKNELSLNRKNIYLGLFSYQRKCFGQKYLNKTSIFQINFLRYWRS